MYEILFLYLPRCKAHDSFYSQIIDIYTMHMHYICMDRKMNITNTHMQPQNLFCGYSVALTASGILACSRDIPSSM